MSPKNNLSAVLNLTFICRSILFLIYGVEIFWNSHVICCLRSCDLKPYWPHNGQVKESCDSETPPPPVTRRNRSLSDEVKMHFDCFDKILSTSKVENWSIIIIPDPSRGWGYYGTPTFHSHYDLTDTSENSKLVHRRICTKVDANIFFSFFFDASERRVRLSAESKILASTFGRFCLYRSTSKFGQMFI